MSVGENPCKSKVGRRRVSDDIPPTLQRGARLLLTSTTPFIHTPQLAPLHHSFYPSTTNSTPPLRCSSTVGSLVQRFGETLPQHKHALLRRTHCHANHPARRLACIRCSACRDCLHSKHSFGPPHPPGLHEKSFCLLVRLHNPSVIPHGRNVVWQWYKLIDSRLHPRLQHWTIITSSLPSCSDFSLSTLFFAIYAVIFSTEKFLSIQPYARGLSRR